MSLFKSTFFNYELLHTFKCAYFAHVPCPSIEPLGPRASLDPPKYCAFSNGLCERALGLSPRAGPCVHWVGLGCAPLGLLRLSSNYVSNNTIRVCNRSKWRSRPMLCFSLHAVSLLLGKTLFFFFFTKIDNWQARRERERRERDQRCNIYFSTHI